MGGSEFLLFEEALPEELKKFTEIKFSPCLGYCDNGCGDPPFVEINGKIIPESNTEKIIQEIKSYLGGMQDGTEQ